MLFSAQRGRGTSGLPSDSQPVGGPCGSKFGSLNSFRAPSERAAIHALRARSFLRRVNAIRIPSRSPLFHNLTSPPQSSWELATSTPGTAPALDQFGAYDDGLGERWVPCTHQLTFQGSAPPDSQGHVYQQVFWYDIDTQVVQQLTKNSHGEHTWCMFEAPHFNHS